MDSMSNDLMRGLETSLPTSERFLALLASSDIDGAAEAYLSEFTKIDSNYHSNIMFYLLKRQKHFKLLFEGKLLEAAVKLLVCIDIPIPETKEFIKNDIERLIHEGYSKVETALREGTTFDIVRFANVTANETLQMMNDLVAMNPDLQKKDISSQMQTLRL